MEELIREVQELLLQFDISKASQCLIEIFNGLEQIEPQLNEKHQEKFHSALLQMNQAMVNQDYLLTADLLEYEIRPLINLAYQ